MNGSIGRKGFRVGAKKLLKEQRFLLTQEAEVRGTGVWGWENRVERQSMNESGGVNFHAYNFRCGEGGVSAPILPKKKRKKKKE